MSSDWHDTFLFGEHLVLRERHSDTERWQLPILLFGNKRFDNHSLRYGVEHVLSDGRGRRIPGRKRIWPSVFW